MENCFFEVGKTYVDMYRREFKVTEVRPHYPHRDTFFGDIYELPSDCDNYYDIYTDKAHKPYADEVFAEKYESFAQGSVFYNKLVEVNKNPKRKDFIVVVPGAHVICDRLEENPETHDFYEYAVVGTGFKNFYNMERLSKEEKREIEQMAEKIYQEIND